MSKSISHLDFIDKIDIVFPKKDWEIISNYISHKDKVKIKTRYGVVEMKANNLLQGKLPTIRGAVNKTDYFINQAKEFSDKYKYNKVKFVDAYTYITITCYEHGDFIIKPYNFLQGQGCSKCALKSRGDRKRITTKDFIEKATLIHNNFYDYSKTIYTIAKEKLIIICPIHGDFEQLANSHLNGNGCFKCGRTEGIGFSKTRFIEHSYNKNPIMYIIKCTSESEESFYKIGITSRTIEERFPSTTIMPYNYEIVYTYICDAKCVWETEKEFHRKYKPFKYTPNKIFGGFTECFSEKIPIESIISELKIRKKEEFFNKFELVKE